MDRQCSRGVDCACRIVGKHMPTCRYLYRVTASQVCGRMSTQILSKRSGARFDVLGLPTQVAPQKLPLSCGSGGGESNHEAEILGLFLNAADFVFSIFLFVVLHPLVDVLFSITQHTVDEAGKHVGHRRDGFWCTQTGSQATELSSQVCLTPP